MIDDKDLPGGESEDEAHGLDPMIEVAGDEEKAEAKAKQKAEEAKNQLSLEDMEKAKETAATLNRFFLLGVDKLVCPSVSVYDVVDPEEGNHALLPLALAMGGDFPPWLKTLISEWAPYAGAGYYIYAAIAGARAAEMAHRQENEKEVGPGGDTGDQANREAA